MRALALVLCVAGPAWAAMPPKVAEAKQLIEDLQLEAALKALDAADKVEGNPREAVVEILLLQGITFGTLGKDAKTRDSFRKLLMLAPDTKLPADLPPRVRTPFFEAKEWASTNGPLSLSAKATLGATEVDSVEVQVERDVLRQAKVARFHFEVGGEDETVDAPLLQGKASAPVKKASVTWWVQVLSERKGVLLETSKKEERVAPVAATTKPVEVKRAEDDAAPTGGWRRPVGVALLGVGAAAAGVGAVFGVMSTGTAAKVSGATRDEMGLVTGVTQRQAAALEAESRLQATLANALFIGGGALAAGGLVLVILGPSREPTVALSPSPGGVLVHGAF
jgi:hypothetical protein